MKKMNVNIDKTVSNAINASQNQHYISPTTNSPPSTPTDNQLLVNNITPGKPSEPVRDNTTQYNTTQHNKI